MKPNLKELLEKELINESQFEKIDAIVSHKVVSVFYELRTLLYLGVMLFTTGAGLLIYQNIGDIGHIVSIGILTIVMIVCFWYTIAHAVDYSNAEIKAPTPYFDYIALLGCLLLVSIQGYVQLQYGLLDNTLGWNTLITALFFFYVAYRFDHIGVLSLAITALASFWSITISPQKWYSSDFFSDSYLHRTAIVFSGSLGAISMILNAQKIKRHFTFTYLNFCLLIYFAGCVAGLFMDEFIYGVYILLIYVGCFFAWYEATKSKSFLFLLYAFIAGYIATTYWLADFVFDKEPMLWFYYSILSCGGFVWFIIRYKNIFRKA
jgi:hypothetical protein